MARYSKLGLLIPLCFSALAADISGTVAIRRTLTKKKVTAPASAYQRGVAVELGANEERDPLAFERSHVAIYLEGDLPSKPVAAAIDQKGRQFVPDLVVVPVGSTVSFPNRDPIFHNVFSLSNPKAFDLGNYSKDQSRAVAFPKPGIVFVHCHLHPNMAAVIVVSPNQWSTKADDDGRFTLPAVPPGRYQVVAWHKTAGYFRKTVQVGESHGAAVQFEIPLGFSENNVSMAPR